MKLKFTQNVATATINYQTGEIYDLDNEKQAKSLVEAGFAVEIKKTQPKVTKTEEPTKPTTRRKRQPKESSEQ